jgi:hypothetical protein
VDRVFAGFLKNICLTRVAQAKYCRFFSFTQSIFKDQTPDRRLPACNERESANIFHAEARTRVRAKGSS